MSRPRTRLARRINHAVSEWDSDRRHAEVLLAKAEGCWRSGERLFILRFGPWREKIKATRKVRDARRWLSLYPCAFIGELVRPARDNSHEWEFGYPECPLGRIRDLLEDPKRGNPFAGHAGPTGMKYLMAHFAPMNE